MAKVGTLNTFVAKAVAAAADVNKNFADLKAAINSIDAEQLSTNAKQLLGLSDGATVLSGQATVATAQSTSATSFADLGTVGPSVTVTVPTNGLVAVLASAVIDSGSLGVSAAVGLHEATTFASGEQILGSAQGSAESRYTAPGDDDGVGQRILGGWLLFGPDAAGAQTYKLVYRSSPGKSVTFSNRRLVVRTFLP